MRIGEIVRVDEREIPMPTFTPPARPEPAPSSPDPRALSRERERASRSGCHEQTELRGDRAAAN